MLSFGIPLGQFNFKEKYIKNTNAKNYFIFLFISYYYLAGRHNAMFLEQYIIIFLTEMIKFIIY
ncbi:hypothetical protein C0J52_24122 [Blattella germanica]|nr:hypothetical protein C0J52_24122 [Blattella germanica]